MGNICVACNGGKEEFTKLSSESPKSDNGNHSPKRFKIFTKKPNIFLEHPDKRIERVKNEKIEIILSEKQEQEISGSEIEIVAPLVAKEENKPEEEEDMNSLESIESQDSEISVDEEFLGDSPIETLSSSLLQMTEEDEEILHTLFREDGEDVPLDFLEESTKTESQPPSISDSGNKGQQYQLEIETATIDSLPMSTPDISPLKSDNRENLVVNSSPSPYETIENITKEDQDLLSEIFGEEEEIDFEAALENEVEGQSIEKKSPKKEIESVEEESDVSNTETTDEQPHESIRTRKRRRRKRRNKRLKSNDMNRKRNNNEQKNIHSNQHNNKNNDDGSFNSKNLIVDDKISSGAYGVVKRGRYYVNGIPPSNNQEEEEGEDEKENKKNNKKKKKKEYLDVAIKEMKVLNAKELRSVEHEINLQKKLDHPNVLGCLGSWFEGNRGFVILELCEKGDLSKYKFRISKSKRMKMRFIEQIANGMKYLHDRNIIHRDLKAQNILVTREKKIKICDFGTSKSVDSFKQSFVGTVEYIPAEIVFGTVDNKQIESDPKLIDVYSFGILIWETWSTKQPFSELRKRIPNPYPLLREIHMNKRRPNVDDPNLSDMPLKMKKLMEKCWSHDPKERPFFDEITKTLKKIRKGMKK